MSATTTPLGRWLRRELRQRDITQNEAAVHAGLGVATVNEVLTKGHVPKIETLFRLADFFGTPRLEILRLAGHLPPGGDQAETGHLAGNDLIPELLAEFRRVPDEWKPAVVEQMARLRRLAELRPPRLVADEAPERSQDAVEPGTESGRAA